MELSGISCIRQVGYPYAGILDEDIDRGYIYGSSGRDDHRNK